MSDVLEYRKKYGMRPDCWGNKPGKNINRETYVCPFDYCLCVNKPQECDLVAKDPNASTH